MKVINIFDSRFDYGIVLRCHPVIDRYHIDNVYSHGYYTAIKNYDVLPRTFLNFCTCLQEYNDELISSFWANEINPPGTELQLED
jgi:hypothetical protein